MMQLVNRLFSRVEWFYFQNRIRLFKTLYINFRTLPFHQAIKFPIVIYGPVGLYNLGGSVEIRGAVRRNMIKLGYKQGFFSGSKGCSMILLASGTKLIFNGPCMFDLDYAIRITGKGVVNIGSYIGFGSDTKIYCEESITIGDYCRIPFGSCFMDTNYHYSIHTESGAVHRKSAPVVIGRYNWIGNTSTIMKGTETPDGTVIASKSFLNKNYRELGNGEENLVLAGSPARIVQRNCTRVLSLDMESYLNEWFAANPEQKVCSEKHLLDDCRNDIQYCKLFK